MSSAESASALVANACAAADHAWRDAAGAAGAAAADSDDETLAVWRCARREHQLALCLLALQHAIEQLTVSSSQVPKRVLSLPPPPPRSADDWVECKSFDSDFGLVRGSDGGFRRLRTSFATPAECMQLRSAGALAMVGAFRRGGETSLSVVPALVERLHGATGNSHAYATLHSLLERVRAAAAADDGEEQALRQQPPCPVCGKEARAPATAAEEQPPPTQLFHRGALLVRLMPPERAECLAPAAYSLHAQHHYWEPHVDQHNVATYDVSAVLYLTSQGEQFQGGAFTFHHSAQGDDYTVAPRAGSLLTFTSGSENPHSAGRVEAGTRYALACWFTRDAAHAVHLPPLAAAAAAEDRSNANGSNTAVAPLPPLPLWASDRAIASAAECSLSSNDPLRERLLDAQAAGRSLKRAVGDAPEFVSGPAAWLNRLTSPPPPEASNDDDEGTSSEHGVERLRVLNAAVRQRANAYQQALQVMQVQERESTSRRGDDSHDDFDIF